jgi:hypothetical protein
MLARIPFVPRSTVGVLTQTPPKPQSVGYGIGRSSEKTIDRPAIRQSSTVKFEATAPAARFSINFFIFSATADILASTRLAMLILLK